MAKHTFTGASYSNGGVASLVTEGCTQDAILWTVRLPGVDSDIHLKRAWKEDEDQGSNRTVHISAEEMTVLKAAIEAWGMKPKKMGNKKFGIFQTRMSESIGERLENLVLNRLNHTNETEASMASTAKEVDDMLSSPKELLEEFQGSCSVM